MKKILVTRSSMPLFDEYTEEIKELWDSRWLTNMGVKHNQFQNEVTSYLDATNTELFTNGHMALELSIQALELEGEVITTPFTFASTIHAIVRNGLKPVFCDINEEDYTIDVSKIEELINENTAAIVPVHVYGNICNVEEIDRIAKKYNLKVIYDAAHTFGTKYKGKRTGSLGDVSCFSFHATKVFHTVEGGAACFRDETLKQKLNALRNFGMKDAESVEYVGPNAKMNEFCAAMGICNLRHIDKEIEKRRIAAERYYENLGNIKGIKLNVVQKDVESNYAYFPVVFNEEEFGAGRDEVFASLAEVGINARKYFYPLANTYECYRDLYEVEQTPVAKKISESVLTLPLYADLTVEDVDRICQAILRGTK